MSIFGDESVGEGSNNSSCGCEFGVSGEEVCTDVKVGVSRGEMNGEGVVDGEVSLDRGESGAAEQGTSCMRLQGRDTTVSGVLLRLCVLPLHPLHRCVLEIQRSLSAGGLWMSVYWVVGASWWGLVALTCCHM